MPIPPLPPCHDIVRFVRSTPEETEFVLLEHLKREPTRWSYQKARSLAPFAFTGDVPLSALKHACEQARMPSVGRAATWDVIQLIHGAGANRAVQCHGMDDGRLRVRQDLTLRVAADFYFVENGRAVVFWLQPRRLYAFTDLQLGMFGALLRRALLRGDFAGADVEILDLAGPAHGPRNPRKLLLDDLPVVDEATVTEGIQRVVEAYDRISKLDIDWAVLKRRHTRADSSEPQAPPDLFKP
jgi:hypothetical protein